MDINMTTTKPEWDKMAPHEAISLFHFKWQREICEVNVLLRSIWKMKLYMVIYSFILGYVIYMFLGICNAYIFEFSIPQDRYILLIGSIAAFAMAFATYMHWYYHAIGQCNLVEISLSLASDLEHDYRIVSKIDMKHHAIASLKIFFSLAKKYDK